MQKKDGRVIPNFINQALNNEDITIYGDGKQTRSFCYIDDTLNFIVNLMNMKKAPKEPINVGNPQEVSILEVAEIVKEITKSSSNIVHKPAMLDDPQRRRPNVLKAKEIIKWEPKVSIEEGIRKTIDYYSRLIV
jgi:nucleoside-diphosphate-sugar epimerase